MNGRKWTQLKVNEQVKEGGRRRRERKNYVEWRKSDEQNLQ